MSSFLARMGRERVTRVTLTNKQLMNLADYGSNGYVTLVPRQGVGTIIYPTSMLVELHAGSSALTGAADLYIAHIDDDGTVNANNIVNLIASSGFITQTTDHVTFGTLDKTLQEYAPNMDNKNLVLQLYALNYGGNSEGDARLSVEITYWVHRRVAAYA